ncbi:MAG: hypothetical protein O2931_14280, partial [Planctomycetota bacterium]|nr:hypothetical protein [Planctomycetota bacterium]
NVSMLGTNGYPIEHGTDCRAHVLIPGSDSANDLWLIAREFGRVELMSENSWRGRIVDPTVNYLCGTFRGTNVWLGGSPGSQLWHSPDFGRTWSRVPTGWNLPIHAMAFSADQVGCFVSALGNILRTTDGGKTWKRVLGGHDRIAVLAVVPSAADVPWELLADVAASDYLARVVTWCAPADHAEEITHALHAASLRTGATAGEMGQRWRLPVSSFSLPTGAVQNQFPGDESSTLNVVLSETIAQAIRQWRPSAMVTVGATVPNALATLTEQSLHRSIELAALDIPSLQSAGQLTPWKVSELWTQCPCDEPSATVRVTRQQLRPLYEDTVGGASDAARLMLRNASRSESGHDMACFRRVVPSATPHGAKRMLEGVALARGASGRLPAPPLSDRDPREWHERVTSQRNAHALLSKLVSRAELEKIDESATQIAAWNHLLQAAEPLNPLDAGPFLYRLGLEYQRQGAAELAVETMRGIVRTGDNHGYARPALEWLWRWETSAEAQFLTAMQTQKRQDLSTPNNPPSTGSSRVISPQNAAFWPTQLMKLGRQRFADWDSDPQVRLSYAAWFRGQDPAARDRPSLDNLQLPFSSPWKSMVSAERWIETGRGLPPWPLLPFRTLAERPLLDGKLQDKCWSTAAIIPLVSTSSDLPQDPSRLLLTGDQEFLYLAIECPRAPGYEYLPPTRDRTRDPDLRGSDRVELFLDVNRDYLSAWKLVLDYRGSVGESLLGSPSWNPSWFVAADGDDQNWRVEAAIPWKELGATSPSSPWVVGAVRAVPERDVQTSQPAIQWNGEYIGLNLLQFN